MNFHVARSSFLVIQQAGSDITQHFERVDRANEQFNGLTEYSHVLIHKFILPPSFNRLCRLVDRFYRIARGFVGECRSSDPRCAQGSLELYFLSQRFDFMLTDYLVLLEGLLDGAPRSAWNAFDRLLNFQLRLQRALRSFMSFTSPSLLPLLHSAVGHPFKCIVSETLQFNERFLFNDAGPVGFLLKAILRIPNRNPPYRLLSTTTPLCPP